MSPYKSNKRSYCSNNMNITKISYLEGIVIKVDYVLKPLMSIEFVFIFMLFIAMVI